MKVRGGVYPKTTQLVASLLYQDTNLDHIEAIKWGRIHEEDALKQFYALEATKHVDFKLEKGGLFLDKDRAYIGASPDSIMCCKCHGTVVIEMKCPYSIKNMTIADGLDKCEFLISEDDKIMLKANHKYHTQINSQIVLSKSNHGYFVVWTTKDILIQKVEKDKKL